MDGSEAALAVTPATPASAEARSNPKQSEGPSFEPYSSLDKEAEHREAERRAREEERWLRAAQAAEDAHAAWLHERGIQDLHLTPDEQKFVLDVEDEWRPYEKRGLQLRHKTGKRINREVGNPDQRQPHASRVIKALSLCLHMSESEISRMRRFPFYFPDFDAFTKKYPKIATWTQVKELLDKLRKGDRKADDDAAGEAKQHVIKGIKLLHDNLLDSSDALHGDDRKQLDELRKEIDEVMELLNVIDVKKNEFKTARSKKKPKA